MWYVTPKVEHGYIFHGYHRGVLGLFLKLSGASGMSLNEEKGVMSLSLFPLDMGRVSATKLPFVMEHLSSLCLPWSLY